MHLCTCIWLVVLVESVDVLCFVHVGRWLTLHTLHVLIFLSLSYVWCANVTVIFELIKNSG